MPHQCLHCGHIFEDSDGKYLRGCPKCQGHRFFYTKQPPTPPAQEKPTTDVSEKVMNLIIEKHETLKNGKNNHVSLTPKELRDLIEQKIDQNTKKTTPPTTDNQHPETIDIEHNGQYYIDLKGLLEKEPIVIQKDGIYTIHLPSAFQMLRKKND